MSSPLDGVTSGEGVAVKAGSPFMVTSLPTDISMVSVFVVAVWPYGGSGTGIACSAGEVVMVDTPVKS